MKLFIIFFSLLFFTIYSKAQTKLSENTLKLDSKENIPEAHINDAAWIAGHWQGEALGGLCEEIWTQPSGNSMMGMFRLIKDEQVAFYEILTISQNSSGLILRIKHFDKNLIGWEEKEETVKFPLVKIEKDAIFFEGMTFKKISDDSIKIFLVTENNNGNVKEIEFLYTKKEK